MAEKESTEPVRPLRNLLIGVCTPAAIIGACAAIGALIAFLSGETDVKLILSAAHLGAIIGFFGSVVGFGDIVVGFFLSPGRLMNRFYRALGYLAVWASVIGAYKYFG